MRVLAGTDEGLIEFDTNDGNPVPAGLVGRPVVGVAGRWRLTPDALFDGPALVASAPAGVRLVCVAEGAGGPWVGGSGARLLRFESGALRDAPGWDTVAGRDEWYTPWGDPAEVRSIATTTDGAVLVNVHVGGIVRGEPQTGTWTPTIDVDADVHQVIAGPDGRAAAAAAVGVCVSDDGGRTWVVRDAGLHATYCRAVARCGDVVIVSASTGPEGKRSCLYRGRIGDDRSTPWERCADGLPEWFDGNVDTFGLAAATDGGEVACAAPGGTIYASADAGMSWRPVAKGLPAVRSLLVAP